VEHANCRYALIPAAILRGRLTPEIYGELKAIIQTHDKNALRLAAWNFLKTFSPAGRGAPDHQEDRNRRALDRAR
jgi:hypothetical protein